MVIWTVFLLMLAIPGIEAAILSVFAPRTDQSSVAAAWYTGWHAADFPLSEVSWSKYTHLTYAFGITTPDVNVISLQDSDKTLLPQFVSTAHQNNVKALLSLGGWTGSRWFSSNVGSAKNRTAFVKTVSDLVLKYELDGLDFDWEFPGLQGIGCNIVHPNDTSNFLSFLQELRQSTVGKNLTLSAATYVSPFADSSGSPSTNISGFSGVLDFISIMNYDIKSSPAQGAGSSSPLDDSCAPPGARFGSAKSAVQAWSSAGMPLNQIVLGVPSYGHSYSVVQDAALPNGIGSNLVTYPSYNPNGTHIGDRWDGGAGLDTCGNEQGPGGIYTYWGLMDEGFLADNGAVQDGIAYVFNNCSQTPFVYDAKSQTYVSYENPQSFSAKGSFIKSMGLRGFAMWEAGGDSGDALLDAIRNAPIQDGTVASQMPSPLPATSSAANQVTPASFTKLSYPLGLVLLALVTVFWT